MSKDQVIVLLDKYLNGECSEAEKQRVLSWLEGIDNESGEWSVLSADAKKAYIEKLYADIQAQMVPDTNAEHKGRRLWYRVAAAILVLIAAGGLLYYMGTLQAGETKAIKYVRTSTGIGEIQRITLDDGTQVWLNALSEIRYPAHFTGNSRAVYVKGEAFFKVAADEKRPFIVRAGPLQTKVLGTSFDISAYPENKNIEVAVLSGKVMVHRAGRENNKTVLTQNEKVMYYKKQAVLRKEKVTNSGDLLAWQQDQLAFYHTPMTEVARVFYRAFGIEIRFADHAVKQYELSGRFDTHQGAENILKAICLSIGGEYTQDGKTVMIRGLQSH